MELSLSGARMAGVSGLSDIMNDVAASIAGAAADEWLNLSVGNPAPIPEVISMWRGALEQSLAAEAGQASCRYGPSRGSHLLVNAVVEYFQRTYGWRLTPDNIVVGPGSQLLCFAAAALFAGPGAHGTRRVVLPLVPDYTGYQALCMHDGGIVGIPPVVRPEGDHRFRYALDIEALRRETDIGLMLISSPGNPTGRAVDQADVDALISLATERDVPLLIDQAYGAPFPRIAEVHTNPVLHDNVINCFTASKAGLPGERVGFAIGAPRYISALTSFVSNAVLHAPQLAQSALARVLGDGRLDHVTDTVIAPYYRDKRLFAEDLLRQVMPADISWRLHSGTGGIFCWLWIDHPWFDDVTLYNRLKEKRVFVVPGRHFFVDPPTGTSFGDHARRCLRISLSAEEKVITEGVHRMAETLREMREGQ